MQGLTTSDYRGGYQWPTSAEDEEEGYPLYVVVFFPSRSIACSDRDFLAHSS